VHAPEREEPKWQLLKHKSYQYDCETGSTGDRSELSLRLNGWHLSAEPTEKLDQQSQDRPAHLTSWLVKRMRRVKLPDLLIEVDNHAWEIVLLFSHTQEGHNFFVFV